MNTPLSCTPPLFGIGFRIPIARWTLANLHRFDVLEVTVDHYIKGGEYARKAIRNLVDRIPSCCTAWASPSARTGLSTRRTWTAWPRPWKT